MTQTVRMALDWLELDPDRLGFSPFDTDTFHTSRVLWLVEEERIIWAEVDWGKVDVALLDDALKVDLKTAASTVEKAKQGDVQGDVKAAVLALHAALVIPYSTTTSDMLGAFLGIQNANDVLRFAQRYGPLRLCQHGCPGDSSVESSQWKAYHKGGTWCTGPTIVKALTETAMASPLPAVFHQENVSDWLRFVGIAKALLSIGIADRVVDAGFTGYSDKGGQRIGGRADWETLMRDWWLYDDTKMEGFFNSVRDVTRLIVTHSVSSWIRMGRVTPALEWGRDEGKPSLRLSASTFGHLGLQLAATLATAKNFRSCDGCGTPFPRIGRAIYCQECQNNKVPARDRKRKFRQTHPGYDKHYRARQIEKQGV